MATPMLDLFDEFAAVVTTLQARRIDYALCGGLAMAVHGTPRATVDIDLMIMTEDLDAVRALAHDLGYTIEAAPMTFHGGDVEIRRISKLDADSGDLLMLDLLLVTPAVEAAWQSRQAIGWEQGSVRVVSREGLIALKALRGSGQDLDDIEILKRDARED